MNTTELSRLVEEAGFLFRGRVLRKGAAGVSLASAEGKIVTVEVEQIFRSTEVMRGLFGKEVAVVSEDAATLEDGVTFLFFTDVIALANHVVVREKSHVKSSREMAAEVVEAVRIAEQRPLRQRVAEAELIILGRVIASHPAEEPSIMRSEHDPEWWIARVRVESVIKGKKAGDEIEVLFANSMDIVWHKAPKLHEGLSGVLLLRRVKANDRVPKAARGLYQATDPLDFLPLERLPEVKSLLGLEKGER